MEDTEIIALYWARNQDAITQTDQRYGRRLFSLANGIVQSFEDAEESVSDTYMKAWQTLPPQRPKFLFAYLATICRHFAFGRLDWKNAAKRKAEVVSLSKEMEQCIPDSSREKALEGQEIGRVLNHFLAGLTPENRLIFLRRYWYCETIAEIAGHCRISESKVKTRLHRLRNRLSRELEKEGIRL